MEGGNSLCLAIVNGDVSYAGWKAATGREQYEPIFACRAVAVAEDEGRARAGHLKRHLQERYTTRLEALRAVTSEEIVQLLLFGGASGGCTAAAAAAAAAAGCGASRLE